MIFNYFLTLLTVVFLSACSFNKIYLQPTKIPVDTRKLTMKSATETTLVQFSDNTYQPTFLKNVKDTIEFDFTIESVVFESSNGNKLNGWILKPKNETPTITLLHFHGNAGFIISQFQAMTPLIKNGFQVFVFDYSGFGFSEGKATRKNVLIDANSALSYVKSRSDIKNTKLIIYGQSLGGHLSAVIASQRQSEIDGLVIEGAFSSHKDIAAETAAIFGRLLVSEKYSAYKSIRAYKKPVLIIHSTEDEVIPIKMGRKIFKNANTPKEFYEIKKCHMCGPEFYTDSISKKIISMLND
ncbi:MAG TPA: alpha/beta fold hydrolase [Vicingaceae bacterium]|nr:alpha/beta fold hydrolase [Vicingaceae bacterium]